MNPPANWYPDPTERHEQRYWDGEQWTEHVYTDGVQGIDPLEAPTTGDEDASATDTAASSDSSDAVAAEDAPIDDADDQPATGEPAAFTDVDAGEEQDPGDEPEQADETDETDEADEGDVDPGRFGEGTAVDPDDGAWSPGDGVALDEEPIVDEESAGVTPASTSAADDAPGTEGGDGGAVAPEVEPADVVASVEDADPATTESTDFADAFLLSPETASRLVTRTPRSEEPREDTEADVDADAADDDRSVGAIDAPPPTQPAGGRPTSLGITGDLVGGAFAEREDVGAVGLQNARLLRCRASSGLIARQGTMVAYQGDVRFEREGAGSVGRMLKRAATGEGLAMMRVSGDGDVFLADAGQHVFVLHLEGGPGLSVNGRNVLAFSASLQWDIERVKGANLLAGGLFNTTLTGTGWVALVSDGEPVVLRTEEARTHVDVNALVAWSNGLDTQIVNTVSAKSLVGLGSGEAFQMAFDGSGIVIVQPSEGPVGGATA